MTGPCPCAITSMRTLPRSTLKRCSMDRLIRMCEEGLDVDCGPRVCARVTGQTIVARKQIGERARFTWVILNRYDCILHPASGAGASKQSSVSRAPSPNVPRPPGLYLCGGNDLPPRRGRSKLQHVARPGVQATYVDREARYQRAPPPHHVFVFPCSPASLWPCLLASLPTFSPSERFPVESGKGKWLVVPESGDSITLIVSISCGRLSSFRGPFSHFHRSFFPGDWTRLGPLE